MFALAQVAHANWGHGLFQTSHNPLSVLGANVTDCHPQLLRWPGSFDVEHRSNPLSLSNRLGQPFTVGGL
jgi:hypothetical protein